MSLRGFTKRQRTNWSSCLLTNYTDAHNKNRTSKRHELTGYYTTPEAHRTFTQKQLGPTNTNPDGTKPQCNHNMHHHRSHESSPPTTGTYYRHTVKPQALLLINTRYARHVASLQERIKGRIIRLERALIFKNTALT